MDVGDYRQTRFWVALCVSASIRSPKERVTADGPRPQMRNIYRCFPKGRRGRRLEAAAPNRAAALGGYGISKSGATARRGLFLT